MIRKCRGCGKEFMSLLNDDSTQLDEDFINYCPLCLLEECRDLIKLAPGISGILLSLYQVAYDKRDKAYGEAIEKLSNLAILESI